MNGVKKRKRFILTVSKKFLAYHKRKGEATEFQAKIISGEKKHTIRPTFANWEKKFKDIEEGKGDLIVVQWSGLPYRTPQEEIKVLSNSDGIGVSKLTYIEGKGLFINDMIPVTMEELAVNDGLSYEDFKDWFKVFPTEPMAIIHLNSFRYGKVGED
jgi:hypothetical protein